MDQVLPMEPPKLTQWIFEAQYSHMDRYQQYLPTMSIHQYQVLVLMEIEEVSILNVG
mgnify:CR=1 FL=1